MHHLPNHYSPHLFVPPILFSPLPNKVTAVCLSYYYNVYDLYPYVHFFSPLVIPLKSELAYKILERGRMRFWLQAEGISSNVTYKFFANNKELSGADVRYAVF